MVGEKIVYVHGTGARDQALAEEYAESFHTAKPVYLLGVDGIEEYTRKGQEGWIKTLPDLKEQIKEKGFSAVVDFCKEICKEKNIKKEDILVDIGSENPLDKGLIDVLTAEGIPCIGPKKEYVRIENDREFTNKILEKIGVKPEWKAFTDPEKAKKYVRDVGYQVVVKAGGLAAGKGSFVCNTTEDAEKAIDGIIINKEFEKHGPNSLKAIVEAREDTKRGKEISFFAYLDGKTFLPLKMFAQDYKLAYDTDDNGMLGLFYHHYGEGSPNKAFSGIRRGLQENNIKIPNNLEQMTEDELNRFLLSKLKEKNVKLTNPNTGGAGCYCPHILVEQEWLTNKIIRKVVKPFIEEIYGRGMQYKGVLYFGLNLNPDNSLSVFEVNVRHGDPEWEVIGRKLKTDLFEIAQATWEGKLDELKRSLGREEHEKLKKLEERRRAGSLSEKEFEEYKGLRRRLSDGELEWNPRHYVDVVAMVGKSRSSRGGWKPGYPGGYEKGYKIEGLDKIESGISILFSGVSWDENHELVTDGGRVLHVVAGGGTLNEAQIKAYENIGKIKFIDHNNNDENCMRYRKTIAED